MKKAWLVTVLTAAATLLAFSFIYSFWSQKTGEDVLKVGFIYEDDESTPYTYNFALAENMLTEKYPERVSTVSRSNVLESAAEDHLRDLVRKGCGIIFTNSYSPAFKELAPEFPEVQICQVSHLDEPPQECPENYHTFKGEIYQGRYVSGVVAGLKLRDLLDHHNIKPEEALVGYVGSFRNAEVVSGYTAFLLGVRSVAPEAVMRVRYTGSWSSFSAEKDCAEKLIEEGCVVISQHSDTIGPALACEEAASRKQVYFVGYNQSMLDVAPTTALVSTRINWTPYVLSAVEAVLEGITIEKYVDARNHGNDMSAGFERGWVEMLDLNSHIAVEGTRRKMQETIERLKNGSLQVFQGNYTGVDLEDPDDTCDLTKGYRENARYSSPGFHYILKNVITEEN
ncbi:MAG: BMP family ABC transporter substrate-binding protein [Blautia sp.]|nr:BMP family ABC transporter substrate-binding protein [Blautia sp.]